MEDLSGSFDLNPSAGALDPETLRARLTFHNSTTLTHGIVSRTHHRSMIGSWSIAPGATGMLTRTPHAVVRDSFPRCCITLLDRPRPHVQVNLRNAVESPPSSRSPRTYCIQHRLPWSWMSSLVGARLPRCTRAARRRMQKVDILPVDPRAVHGTTKAKLKRRGGQVRTLAAKADTIYQPPRAAYTMYAVPVQKAKQGT